MQLDYIGLQAQLPVVNPAPPQQIMSFEPGLTLHWQLDGEVDTRKNVDVYGIDLFDHIESGKFVEIKELAGKRLICYFSAGSYEDWREDAAKFPADTLIEPLTNWPGEQWVDFRRQEIRDIMAARMDLAAANGCDAVEPDNVDGYLNIQSIDITPQDQIDYLLWLADYAHSKNLSIGLKNALDLIEPASLHTVFDWALVETCYPYRLCNLLQPFINQGKAVFIAEYGRRNLPWKCSDAIENNFYLVFYNRALDGAFRYACLGE